MTRRTPVLASWLLQRFGATVNDEALAGDLAEEYSNGRSALWYWWQASAAICLSVVRDVRGHKLLTLRAVATGWGLLWLHSKLMNPLIHWFQFSGVIDWHHTSGYAAARLFLALVAFTFLMFGLAGWLAAVTHRAVAPGMVMIFILSNIPTQVLAQIHQYHHPTSPIPYQWAYNLAGSCLAMLCFTIGGLVPRPSPKERLIVS